MSWIEDESFAADRPFGPQTLPYGVIDTGDGPNVAVRVGDHALPLRPVADTLGPRLADVVTRRSLDPLLATSRATWGELRERLSELVTRSARPRGAELVPLDRLAAVLPFTVSDYVDFYSSRDHAGNASSIFRPRSPSLPENWTHLPIGYHGRAGTVVVSGTDVVRPQGQRRGAEPGSVGVRRDTAAGRRGGGRVRVRRSGGQPGADGRRRRAHLRCRAGQRLVRAGHAGLGVTAARPVPRQVVRHVDRRVDHATGGVRARPRPGTRSALSRCSATWSRTSRGAWPSTSRSAATARSCRRRRSPVWAGRAPSSWPT